MDAKTDTAPIEILEELLASRFSCRAFKPDPMPRATVERILAAAQKTASWCNSQPWQLVVASGAATRKFRDAMY
ncbi:MAG TPA: nitroreductase family protein, partial [Bradyrhizobium sp.]|nr:nitroreductase family protein [Bradyrhizobium sp.]